MPSFLTVVKDTSPMLAYSGSWQPGTSESDSLMDQYTENTFTLTQTLDSTMTFKFYGSYIGVFGAKRANHGSYAVQLDGNSSVTSNGLSSQSQFNQTLFSGTMNLGSHVLTVVNQNSTFFDIDYVAFQTSVGKDDEDLIVNTYQDGHPAFNYTPPSAWTIPTNVGTFSGGSGHATIQGSAQAILTFEVRDAITLYGPVGPNGVNSYSIQVDNGSAAFFSANKQSYRPQQILFYAGNLGEGQHTLRAQTNSTASGEFAIDYANVYSAPSLGGSYVYAAAPNVVVTGSPALQNNARVPLPLVIGFALIGAFAILLSALCFYLFRRMRLDRVNDWKDFEGKNPPSPSHEVAQQFILPPFSNLALSGSQYLQGSYSSKGANRVVSALQNSLRSSQSLLPSDKPAALTTTGLYIINDTDRMSARSVATGSAGLGSQTSVLHQVIDDGTQNVTLGLPQLAGRQSSNPPPRYSS